LNMTSQEWLSHLDVGHTEWSHALVVVIPDNLEGPPSRAAGWATLYISFGAYGTARGPPISALSSDDPDVNAAAAVAARTGAPAAVLFGVPPEVKIVEDERSRNEDDLLSYAQQRFLRTFGAQRWIVELPMAKAVVRAMDTIEAFSAAQLPAEIRNFTVMGTSKRGLATWHAAAVDPRVLAIVPMVRTLNSSAFLRKTVRSYGGMPVVAVPYMTPELVEAAKEEPELVTRLQSVLDPVSYPERFTNVAKLVVDAARDDFFMPDHTSTWWTKIPGPKAHLVVPDGGHIVGAQQVAKLAAPISAFIRARMLGEAPPPLSWSLDATKGQIVAALPAGAPRPTRVELWQARTCDATRRDFRIRNFDRGAACARCGVPLAVPPGAPPGPTCENTAARWSSAPLDETIPGSGLWTAQVAPPADGRWAGFFLQFDFPGPAPPQPGGAELQSGWQMATEVLVVPDTYPFPDPGPNSSSSVMPLVLLRDD